MQTVKFVHWQDGDAFLGKTAKSRTSVHAHKDVSMPPDSFLSRRH